MYYLRGCLCSIAALMGLAFTQSPEATLVGSDTSHNELAWRGGHHDTYYYNTRGNGRYYGRYPVNRYYRQRPYYYRSYYYTPTQYYYYQPSYNGPYHRDGGVYIYFRT